MNRRIEVERMVVDGDTVATYGLWSSTVAMDGLEWPKGAKLTVPIAQFFTVRNDKITSCIDFLTHPVALTG